MKTTEVARISREEVVQLIEDHLRKKTGNKDIMIVPLNSNVFQDDGSVVSRWDGIKVWWDNYIHE